MRVFVTGIGGFVGSRLALHLAARGDRVAGTYIDQRPEIPGAELTEADLADRPALARAIAAFAPDAVVHLAGLSHVGESWQRVSEYFRVNVLGTENLLAAAGGARVVFASSAEVYGRVPEDEQPIGEGRPLDPHTPYALTKAAAERLAFLSGAVVVRSFNLVGPGQSPRFALPGFADQLAAISRRAAPRGEALAVGNLSARRDFVHVDDGVRAYRLLAERGEPGTAYNLATGRAWSMEEVLARLVRLSGVAPRIEPAEERMRPVDLPLLCGDPGRLEALGWHPERSLDDALTDLWRAVAGGLEEGGREWTRGSGPGCREEVT